MNSSSYASYYLFIFSLYFLEHISGCSEFQLPSCHFCVPYTATFWVLPTGALPSPLLPAILLLYLQTPPLTHEKLHVPRALAQGQVLLASSFPARGSLSPQTAPSSSNLQTIGCTSSRQQGNERGHTALCSPSHLLPSFCQRRKIPNHLKSCRRDRFVAFAA